MIFAFTSDICLTDVLFHIFRQCIDHKHW